MLAQVYKGNPFLPPVRAVNIYAITQKRIEIYVLRETAYSDQLPKTNYLPYVCLYFINTEF